MPACFDALGVKPKKKRRQLRPPFGSIARTAGANSIIGCAAVHIRSKCASNFVFASPPANMA
jgi:hypothetical protein